MVGAGGNLQLKEFDFVLPKPLSEDVDIDPEDPLLLKLQQTFIHKATTDLFHGCVGAVDGWQCFIQTPSINDVGHNILQYFNGHYSRYGINVQAMCDGHCRFTLVSVVAPGGQHDVVAYGKSNLPKFVEKLPKSFFVVADNAYMLSPQMLVPFLGTELRVQEMRDVYNFFLYPPILLVVHVHTGSLSMTCRPVIKKLARNYPTSIFRTQKFRFRSKIP
jgi:DDE superfamily endonuclease